MKKRVIVIGGGPGGYVAALRASQLGASVTLIEEKRTGGVCLNEGCIPTKVLLHSAEVYRTVSSSCNVSGIFCDNPRFDWGAIMSRKSEVVNYLVNGVDGLLQAAGVVKITGRARLLNNCTVEAGGLKFNADAIIIAVGSEPSVPPVPGLELDGILTSTHALSISSLPENIAIAGGGVIGVEFASIFAAFGVKVTVIEMLPQILPNIDSEVAGILRASLERQGITFHTGARLKNVSGNGSGYSLELETGGVALKINSDKVLVATGRRPSTAGMGLAEAGVELQRGRISVNSLMETSLSGVYAIGDCTGRIMLAHVASREGEVAAENIMSEDGSKTAMDYKTVPSVIYTAPTVASVGLSEEDALKRGYEVKVGRFPLAGNGKSVITGDADGMIKIVSDGKYGEILGIHMLGGPASDMIAEAGLALRLEATLEELITTIHPHPTVSEAVAEAAMAVFGQAIHFPAASKL